MSFTNLYYKRTAGTAKACYVCSRPTTIVLATINTTDFVYTCPGHLSDQGFASLVRDSLSPSTTLTPEEIKKVKEEWEEKQKKKAEKEKQKEKEEKDKTDDDTTKPVAPSRLGPAPSTPTHERYVLHRDFFAMRQSEHRKRRQVSQAKELAPRLPGAPQDDIKY
ncbi:uncharacterized protein LACBIDRAFT_305764 [Laccaria bicolor S238N-H82]|uniref:Predicted protein n=1 Tax=Laccaria bicolor (strain S238N-H82 / ATCC MYA-4686) TaxID=486041 RepID=B0CRW2_LACBS|nr:uncharacterized protein LACBIDRAFT_305764 [Laccaria bicolor S238N-H82]EDR14189.1 predicted protein [Laccaria bicolor S238N-H82]|eukprot:XP_001874748.1 predicted protein [Laccaria bicolor S238N-H82]